METNTSCVDNYESTICASVITVHLSAHTRLAIAKTKIDLDSHADTCVVGDHCLNVHDHNRPVNVYGYDPNAGSKLAHIVSATVAYEGPETGQNVILLLNEIIEMNGLDHHVFCSIQCCMNGVLIDEVPKLLVPVPSETMHAIQIVNAFDATHPLIISLKLIRVASYFKVRKPTQGED